MDVGHVVFGIAVSIEVPRTPDLPDGPDVCFVSGALLGGHFTAALALLVEGGGVITTLLEHRVEVDEEFGVFEALKVLLGEALAIGDPGGANAFFALIDGVEASWDEEVFEAHPLGAGALAPAVFDELACGFVGADNGEVDPGVGQHTCPEFDQFEDHGLDDVVLVPGVLAEPIEVAFQGLGGVFVLFVERGGYPERGGSEEGLHDLGHEGVYIDGREVDGEIGGTRPGVGLFRELVGFVVFEPALPVFFEAGACPQLRLHILAQHGRELDAACIGADVYDRGSSRGGFGSGLVCRGGEATGALGPLEGKFSHRWDPHNLHSVIPRSIHSILWGVKD